MLSPTYASGRVVSNRPAKTSESASCASETGGSGRSGLRRIFLSAAGSCCVWLRLKAFLIGFIAFVCVCRSTLTAADEASYRLFPLDRVTFSVHGEGSLSAQLRVSGNGTINVPLLGDVRVAGLTLAEAERKIQETYVAGQIFIRPQITLQVVEYSKKEISLFGQFARQGRIEFPAESASLGIVQAVSVAGGFTRIARSDSVRVTRKDPVTGEEKVFIVNVERMISGRGNEENFLVYPGDTLFVAERLF